MNLKLYRTGRGALLETDDRRVLLSGIEWDDVFRRDQPARWLLDQAAGATALSDEVTDSLLPPIGSQEVWAAGVTYYRSRSARMDESAEAGGGDFYDRVYEAPRPELFFKATPHRVVGHQGRVRIRADARWNVPEPELTVCVNASGRIIGVTIGNDMSSRDIEGENPLYLPQAKTYDGCCALGPGILLTEEPLPDATEIGLSIRREGSVVFSGTTDLGQMKRRPAELVEYLFRESSFPTGCFLLTGTGIVPPNDFTLQSNDEIQITIEPIGTLRNIVE